MKRLHFQIPNNLNSLHDELLAAVPSVTLVTLNVGPDGQRHAVMQVEGTGNDIWLTVPDDTDEAAIAVVVLAHDPNSPRSDPAAQRGARIRELLAIPRSNWTTAQRNELLELTARRHFPSTEFEA